MQAAPANEYFSLLLPELPTHVDAVHEREGKRLASRVIRYVCEGYFHVKCNSAERSFTDLVSKMADVILSAARVVTHSSHAILARETLDVAEG